MAVKNKKVKAYEVHVTMTVTKTYTVVADDESEAIEKLAESGIVTAANESKRDENYDEQYDVGEVVEVEEPDLD